MSLLTRPDGRASDGASLGMWFAQAIEQAALRDACAMRGLRKTAARTLAEVGCSAHEITSVTGHKPLAQVENYTRAADPRRLATATVHRLQPNGNRTVRGKRALPFDWQTSKD
jgi:Phage integrase family